MILFFNKLNSLKTNLNAINLYFLIFSKISFIKIY
jgi:hypothetical protein